MISLQTGQTAENERDVHLTWIGSVALTIAFIDAIRTDIY